MAAFREHVTFSSVLGIGYGAALWHFLGADPGHAVLAGCLCGASGMLPDVDSDSGKPVRELFGLFAVAGALGTLLIVKRRLGLDGEIAFLAAVGVYVFVRVVMATVFKKITVHRGMCHSLPAAVIVAAIFYLLYDGPVEYGKYSMAGAALLGFLSHLVLDEIYAVDLRGVVPKLNAFAGTALKLRSSSMWANTVCWLIMGALLYQIAVEEHYVEPLFVIPERRVSLREKMMPTPGKPTQTPEKPVPTRPEGGSPVSLPWRW